jgi:hypothetical protein
MIEAPSLYHARTRAVVDGIGWAQDYSEGKEVNPKYAAQLPQDCIDRLLMPDEARQLIDRVGATQPNGVTVLRAQDRES